MFQKSERPKDFWALKDVSFKVNAGESVGIVGKNGAGKSTLLKILSRVTPPTTGSVVCRGRVVSLLEVGTGFHQELSGRENIFMNGSILGMRRHEIIKKFDEIVAFSGVEQFIDVPIKHYSSGMQLRLAFSVSAFLEPEIMIIDEVLAVGDAEFQKKCIGKMEDVSKSGRTILFVSHNLAAVSVLCQRAVLLESGQVAMLGSSDEVIARYQQALKHSTGQMWERSSALKPALSFMRVGVTLSGTQPDLTLLADIYLQSQHQHAKAFLAIDILNSLGVVVMQAIPTIEPFIEYTPQGTHVQVVISLPPLIPDFYTLTLWTGSHNTDAFDFVPNAVSFEVHQSPTVGRTYPHSLDHGSIVPKSHVAKVTGL